MLLGEGDPYEVLAESKLDDDVAALICSAELWAFPPDLPEEECVGRPSERDDRVELRTVVCVSHDGPDFAVNRLRGAEAVLERDIAGPLVDDLRNALRPAN